MSEPKVSHHLTAGIGKGSGSSEPAAVTAHRRLPDDHPAYALIGRVAAAWAELEHVLDVIIWKQAQLDWQTGSCITGNMIGSRPRFETIMALAKNRGIGDKDIKEWNKLMGRVSQTAKLRNRFVHDAWYIDTAETVGQFKSFSYSDPIFGFVEVTESFAEEVVAQIIRLIDNIMKLSSRLP